MPLLITLGLLTAPLFSAPVQSSVAQTITDQIYYKNGGAAFTYDVAKPVKPTGQAVIWVVSGGWVSDHKNINPALGELFCKKGITLFQVVHGTQPKYKMKEIVDLMHRSVKHIRFNAKTWGIDPNKIGISGASAGGHLSLMLATQTLPAGGTDPVSKTSSEVQASAVFFPPTDFNNWGAEGIKAFDSPMLFAGFGGAFELGPTAPKDKILQMATDYSPAAHVTKSTPPVLLIHGDKDPLVPIQQSAWMKAKLDAVGVKCEFVTVPDGAHGWANMMPQLEQIVDFYAKTLK